ncbi:transposase [Calothrix sp. NIES-4071]|nr:transposase [Calothrix sp. NIES-4071]BAZ57297.1 transposase [Calothrix sp. NIES-4105]
MKDTGREFVVVEESYTSKMSFFDGDELPVYGEPATRAASQASGLVNPKGKETEAQKEQKPSGKRTKRGEYKTGNGIIVNADANGASNILRKAKIDISKITFRVCQVIAKINIWVGNKRKGTAASGEARRVENSVRQTSPSSCTTIGATEPAQ